MFTQSKLNVKQPNPLSNEMRLSNELRMSNAQIIKRHVFPQGTITMIHLEPMEVLEREIYYLPRFVLSIQQGLKYRASDGFDFQSVLPDQVILFHPYTTLQLQNNSTQPIEVIEFAFLTSEPVQLPALRVLHFGQSEKLSGGIATSVIQIADWIMTKVDIAPGSKYEADPDDSVLYGLRMDNELPSEPQWFVRWQPLVLSGGKTGKQIILFQCHHSLI